MFTVTARHGVRTLPDWQATVADLLVTVIHNCSPNHLHSQINLAALNGGKHVFSEKPLGCSPVETALQLEVARASKLHHGVHFTYRGYPMVSELRERVRRSDIGELRFIRGRYFQDWLLKPDDYNWRLEGTAEETRLRPTSGATRTTFASAEGCGTPYRVQSEDQVTLLVEYGTRVSANFDSAQVYAGHLNDFALELFGTHGSLAWTQQCPEELSYGRRDQPLETLRKSAALTPAAAALAHYPTGHPEGYPDAILNVIRAFYAGIGSDARMYPSFSDGHAAALAVAAAYRSHHHASAWVTLE